MKKALLITGLTVVAAAGIATFVAVQGHKQSHGAVAKAAPVAATTSANPDLEPSAMCDYSVPSVSAEAKAIARAVPDTATDRDTRIATATREWVVSHVAFQSQSAPSPADVTLLTKTGNDASQSALIAAMLRADGIQAEVQLVPVSDVAGYFGTSMPMRYVVMASVNSQSVELDTPYQHRNPQPLTDSGTLPW